MFKFNDKLPVDIRPTTSIYSTYSRLSYTLWHAIAEFVDNSTASYFEKENILKQVEKDYKLKVIILYHKDNKNKENHYLKIIDNAYGMDLENFKRALQINKPPQNRNGRNEFGMGLKTAACWFGKE
ncbi:MULTISPECIES: ATP-binding protein [unclassified Spiroplasma]|uniref:ATP-binding protein n=1 Tax=unclassified Spiroplasma TaxID=2637901 RepID=UPI0030CB16A0